MPLALNLRMHLPSPFVSTPFIARQESRIRWLVTMLCVTLAAWAQPSQATAASRFEHLRQQDSRVAAVAYRLSISGEALCLEMLSAQPGFVLHSLAQYAPRDREGATSSYGLGRHMGVITVVPGSPAAVAGLQANDQLVSINGIPLTQSVGSVPSRGSVEGAEKIIAGEMRKGMVMLADECASRWCRHSPHPSAAHARGGTIRRRPRQRASDRYTP